MKAVILAGGLGTRLKEVTEIKPKPLVEVDLTDIFYHRHRETIALPPPDPEVVGQG
jgi:dTDP-glucose pyrophosphorylase